MRKLFFATMTLLLSVGFMNAQNAAPAKTAKVASATPKKQAPKLVVPAAVKAKIKLGNNRFYVNWLLRDKKYSFLSRSHLEDMGF